MLQQQVSAPGIPRFNPHGYQPPPQEKKKEESTASLKPFGVRQKVEEEVVVDFKQFNIEDLLSECVSLIYFAKPASIFNNNLKFKFKIMSLSKIHQSGYFVFNIQLSFYLQIQNHFNFIQF